MKIDWFDFWLIFSGLLILFLLIGLIIRFFQWLKFRQELAYIKDQKIQNIVNPQRNTSFGDSISQEKIHFKQEIDSLKKDVCFDLYDNQSDSGKETMFSFDFEESLEKLLDGKILDLIKEKDLLLQQKDGVIGSLEEKNQKILKEIVNKMFFLLAEKDKLLKDKDTMIYHLKSKIQEITLTDVEQYVSQLAHPSFVSEKKQPDIHHQVVSHNPNDFLNVNAISKK